MTTVVETFTGTNGDPAPSPWIPVTLSGSQSIQSNKWRITNGDAYGGTAMTYGTNVYTDVDITTEITTSADGNDQYPAVGARLSGGTNGWASGAQGYNGYVASMFTTEDNFYLSTMTGGAAAVERSVVFTIVANTTYKVRLQCTGTTIQAKIWDASGAEPGSWNISVTDTVYASGWIGFRDQSPSNVVTSDWDNYTITGDPQAAPALAPVLIQSLGTQVSNSAATTTAISFGGGVKPQVGDLVVMYGSRDNTASDPLTDSFTDSNSNTYTIVNLGSNTGTALAGLVGCAAYSIITTAWSAGTNTLTWTHPSTKAAMQMEHWRYINGFRGSNSAQSTAGAPSCALAGVLAGDLVLAMEALEYSTAGTSTGDADTTNGSWSAITGPTATTGTTLAAVKVIAQWKITTADGTQTYNPTHSVTTNVSAVAIVLAFSPPQYNTSRYLPRGDAVRRAATW